MSICLFTIRVCDFFFVHSDNDCGFINIDEGVPVIGMVLVYMFCDTGISNSQDIVPETLPEESLSKMSTPPKSESPIITPDELTEADGFVFGFPTRYGMMAAQFKVFLDTTGGLRRTQSLAGKPAGSSTALALKVVAKKPLLCSSYYRGDQLRYGFVSHLIDAFERYGIMFFIDKDEQRGKDLTNLFVRMKESKIALVIFSSRYAESSWCMDELVNIKKRAEKGKLEVIPIFYKVRAKDVRAQTGKFGDKFWALAKVSSGDQIKKWKDALECISNKMGFSSEADFIKGIVKEVERVRTATVRGGAQSHHCIKFIPNKRIKICKKFPEDEAKSVEIAHMNFSNARGEEEQNQEVLVLNHDFVK
ncbi:unnamed protein product [Brassica oleracea]